MSMAAPKAMRPARGAAIAPNTSSTQPKTFSMWALPHQVPDANHSEDVTVECLESERQIRENAHEQAAKRLTTCGRVAAERPSP